MDRDTSFTDLLASAQATDQGLRFEIPEDWMQGRTTYGGLSTTLALEAAMRSQDALLPLRSATVSFVGPVGGEVFARAQVLRSGRSVTFVESEVVGAKGPATRCVFVFAAARESALEGSYVPAPEAPDPAGCEPYLKPDFAPQFTKHFDCRLVRGARPGQGSSDPEVLLWVRHRDAKARGTSALLALADMPPPAVLPMFPVPDPASSMTWLCNIFHEETDEEGWWLLSTRADQVAGGYSSQDMFVWNREGMLCATGRQSVAVFG